MFTATEEAMRHKTCDRCKSIMLQEHINLSGESLGGKLIPAYHCVSCGRSEYGIHASASETDFPTG
jgi:hypothetical protein